METKLKENSQRLGISIFDLIDRYVRRGIYSDNHYMERPRLSFEQLKEISKRGAERIGKEVFFLILRVILLLALSIGTNNFNVLPQIIKVNYHKSIKLFTTNY